jgi:hypothetical protein
MAFHGLPMLQREQQELILNKKDAVIAEYVKKGGG